MNKKYLIATLLFVLLSVSCSISGSSGNGGQDSVSDNTIATVESIYVTSLSTQYYYAIWVELKPTSEASAGVTYTVDLYEYGEYRASDTIQWSQPQINVQTTLQAEFPATRAEHDAYFMESISHIFSVKVH